MWTRTLQYLLIACLMTGTSWAANDPFVGKWKVNPGKSKLIDEMQVEAIGANRYRLRFAPDAVDTVVADGSDQPALSGTTLSVTVKGLHSWEVVRKMKGRPLLKAEWTLSDDGKSVSDAFTQYLPNGMSLFSTPLPDGSTLFMPYVYARTAGTSGFPGTWDSESATVNKGIKLQIQPDEGDGLSFGRSDEATPERIQFDGKDHPGPDGSPGQSESTYAGRRVNDHRLEITLKTNGQVTGSRMIELSADLKTLTMTERLAGQSEPKSVLVFDRE